MSDQVSPFSLASTWDLVAPGYARTSIEHFENYARDALAIANVQSHERVLDVAAGPGSLAVLASQRASRVEAVDFSHSMLAQLRLRVSQRDIQNVTVVHADGQRLPFSDGSFDAAFSMFGLMFFPDRALGFAEMRRVLRPGGRCVVASWHPMDKVEQLGAVFDALYAEMPHLPQHAPDIPLGEPNVIAEEMSRAGLTARVSAVTHEFAAPSMTDFWNGIRESFAPIVLLENELGASVFDTVADGILRRLIARYGDGRVVVPMSAWLAVGQPS